MIKQWFIYKYVSRETININVHIISYFLYLIFIPKPILCYTNLRVDYVTFNG